ncbi:MAG: permease [Anaerolineaceae bacterium]|nr:permease [Anaerolineaceae bacterium]
MGFEFNIIYVYIALIVFFATMTRAAIGFGGALIAMPLLTLLLPIKETSPLVALMTNTNAIFILLGSWREVRVKSAWRLILASLVGIPIGVVILSQAYQGLVTGLLGVIIILFAGYSLFNPEIKVKVNENTAFLFGFFAGILGGAYNANGPLVVIYATMRKWPAEKFRATLQGYFFPIGLVIIFGYVLSGLYTRTVFLYYLYAALPATFLGYLTGNLIHHRIPQNLFKQMVYLLLIAVGVSLIIKVF